MGPYWTRERHAISASEGDYSIMDAWYKAVTKELLPCPCCGGRAYINGPWIFCEGCSLRACGSDFIDDWQRREGKE